MKISGALISDAKEKDADATQLSKFEITIEQEITVTESFYATVSFTKLLTELGGSLGLWLGVGINELWGHGANFVVSLQTLLSNKA